MLELLPNWKARDRLSEEGNIIIIDSNEYHHNPKMWEGKIGKIDNIEVDFLVVGEAANFAVERKEFLDLRASLTGDGRLWQQVGALRQLRDQGYTPFVACIGNEWLHLSKLRTMTDGQYTGLQVGIARNSVSYIHFNNDEGFLAFLASLNERSGKAREYIRPTIHKPERTLVEERADMVSAVAGIGMKTAMGLVAQSGTVEALCRNAREGKLKIGKKAGRHLAEVLLGQFADA